MNKNVFSSVFKRLKGGKGLVALGIAGIALIGISSLVPGQPSAEKQDFYQTVDTEEYRLCLQNQIKDIVKEITGDKSVSVVITLETGVRREYAGETEDFDNQKTDQSGSERESDKKKKAITVKASDGSEQALIVTEYMPQVRGVAVVCNTGGNEQVREAVTGAVTAALGITSKRVYVGGY